MSRIVQRTEETYQKEYKRQKGRLKKSTKDSRDFYRRVQRTEERLLKKSTKDKRDV